jgi:hypothetical protein
MNEEPLPESLDLDWYLEQNFKTDKESFRKYYIILIRYFGQYVCSRYFIKCRPDFEDYFQIAMMKLYVLTTQKNRQFKSNREAFNMVKRLFYCAMVDDYRRKMRSRLTEYIPQRHDTEAFVELYDNILDKRHLTHAELFFEKIEKVLLKEPSLISKREREFYELYKAYVLHPRPDISVRNMIMSKMNIDKRYYARIKTTLKDKITEKIFKTA